MMKSLVMFGCCGGAEVIRAEAPRKDLSSEEDNGRQESEAARQPRLCMVAKTGMKGRARASGDLMGGGSKWEHSRRVFTGTGGR